MNRLFSMAIVLLSVSTFLPICHAFTSLNNLSPPSLNARTAAPQFVGRRNTKNSLRIGLHEYASKSTLSLLRRHSMLPSSLHSQASNADAVEEEGDDEGTKLTFRQKLRKMGTQVVLSYGFVSNMGMAATVTATWYVHSARTGISPLAPGQKKAFLAVYSGFYLFMNIIRPARFALAVAVSKYFDKGVKSIQRRLNVSKGLATFFLVLLANIFGTFVALGLGISLASAASGVPIWRTQ
mmetsp:Transcript_1156/g.1387  ORF Transcript_1156/g.1387 Transcript_1156/m.1387 type:complete len:238 (-) Transcript_1156:265-978(-)